MADNKFDFIGLYNKLCSLAQNCHDYAKSNLIIKTNVLQETKHNSIVSYQNDFNIDAMTKVHRYSKAIALLELLDTTKSNILSGNLPPGEFVGKQTTLEDPENGPIIPNSGVNKDLIKEIEKLTLEKQQLEININNKKLFQPQALTEEINKTKEEVKQLSDQLAQKEKELEEEKDKKKPLEILVKSPNQPDNVISLGDELIHYQFPELLKLLTCRNQQGFPEFLYGWGAPGCGKTKMGEMIAKSLAQILGKKYPEEFGYYHLACTPQTTEGKTIGFKNQMTGEYIPGAAYKAYKEGGLFALDEVDKSDPSMLAGSGNSLENGQYMFGTETVTRHKDFYMVAWANTKGTGATGGFASNKIDMATLDRFTMVEVLYDEQLEHKICTNKDWAFYCQKVRKYIKDHCNQSIYITTRAVRKGDAYLSQGIATERVLESVLFKLVSNDIRQTIERNVGSFAHAKPNINLGPEQQSSNLSNFINKLDAKLSNVGIIGADHCKIDQIKIFREQLDKFTGECPGLAYSKTVIEHYNEWFNHVQASGKVRIGFKGINYKNENLQKHNS